MLVIWAPGVESQSGSYLMRLHGLYQSTNWSREQNTSEGDTHVTGLFPGDLYTFEVTAVWNYTTNMTYNNTNMTYNYTDMTYDYTNMTYEYTNMTYDTNMTSNYTNMTYNDYTNVSYVIHNTTVVMCELVFIYICGVIAIFCINRAEVDIVLNL